MRFILKTTLISLYIALFCNVIICLKHHLVLTDDKRVFFSVSSFGYLVGGRLEVIVQNLTLNPDLSEDFRTGPQYGFMLTRADHTRNPFLLDPRDNRRTSCTLNDPYFLTNDLITLSLDPANGKVLVRCMGDTRLSPITSLPNDTRRGVDVSHGSFIHTYTKRAAGVSPPDSGLNMSLYPPLSAAIDLPEAKSRPVNFRLHKCPETEDLPLIIRTDEDQNKRSYSFNFTMLIRHPQEEGFYYLTFHNCRGFKMPRDYYDHPTKYHRDFHAATKFNLSMLIYETNYLENYLSAGLMPLPQMYFVLSVMFFLLGCIWVNFIARQKEVALKIHYLMTVLVFAKSCSLLFRAINYHYIALAGQPVVTWAYLYYATRSLKGVLFFITLALIGSGWSFIKHILSDKDKKIIIFIVALQVIAHVAEIVLDQSTEGEIFNEFWAQLCSIVDLFCCVAILYPISWSVKHLEEASRTDGKAAINLKKLELFKRFYIISTIYIYVTRIVTFVFLSMLTFRYSWLAELVTEVSTLIYFVITGYYFQPMPTNPYLLLSSDNDLEEDILFSLDSHDMRAIHHNDANLPEDKKTLLDEEDQKVTRRVVEEIV